MPACGGRGCGPKPRACAFDGLAIHEVTALTVERAAAFFAELEFAARPAAIAEPLVTRDRQRGSIFCDKWGSTISRSIARPIRSRAASCSAVRLATGIGSGLVGVCYVLDEPSIGLHPRDNERLIDALRELAAARQHGAGRRARRSDDARRPIG